MLKKITALLSVLAMTVPLMCGCVSSGANTGPSNNPGEDRKSVSRTFFMFETIVTATIYGSEDGKLVEACGEFLKKYDDIFSATRQTSELYKINNSPDTETEISEDLYITIKRSLEMCEQSEGRFDITVRPVSQLWDFAAEEFVPPADEMIKSALENVSYGKIGVRSENGRYFLHRDNSSIMIDLGAVSKGYISDKLREYALSIGIRSAVFDIAGNIMCVGGKDYGGDAQDFQIGIYDPVDSEGNDPVIVNVRDKCVISSGVYQRNAEYNGRTYHHILDARTGMPAEGDLVSVNVVCDEGLMGDMLSTGLFLMGEEGIVPELPEGVAALYIYKDGTRKYYGNFDDLLKKA
ncbi:MAG: FAD:protein FMN transferase [Lachnospiraceae bacterium]|nr:FAD:protein FMN transferase [Lachnospiraceae bacterium]